MEIHKPPNEKVIDEVWIGLSEDKDGKNGICAAFAPGTMPTSTRLGAVGSTALVLT